MTTVNEVLDGLYPVGTKVVLGAYVVEVMGSDVVIGAPFDCPPGYACGDMLVTMWVDSTGVTLPPENISATVYGSVASTAEVDGTFTLVADAWVY